MGEGGEGGVRGAAVTLCHTHGPYQIGMSTSTSCFTNIDVFSDEQ